MGVTDLADLVPTNEPKALLAHCPASLTCLPVSVFPIPAEAEIANDLHPNPRLLVAHAGQGRRWYSQGGMTRVLSTAPGMMEIYERGLSFDHCRWQGEIGRTVMIEFVDADVRAMTHGELQRLPLRTQHEVFDARISGLALDLAQQALQGLPGGPLYAQGLSLTLLGLLSQRFGAAAAESSATTSGRLGARQQRRLADLIREHPGDDLSLTRLAAEVGLSPHHFLRVFKAAFGLSPHRYVQRCRLQSAMAALRRQPARTIAEIALEHGFASQAPMTDTMRRVIGVTPGAWRRQA